MPPALMPWALSADIAALPSGLTVAIRQFLARAPGLSPASRHTLGVDLLASTLASAAPQPPPGSHPAVVLSALAADRSRPELHPPRP